MHELRLMSFVLAAQMVEDGRRFDLLGQVFVLVAQIAVLLQGAVSSIAWPGLDPAQQVFEAIHDGCSFDPLESVRPRQNIL